MDYAIFRDIIDVLYKLSIMFVSFILIIGYIFDLGYRKKLKRYLEKSRSFEIKINSAVIGYILLNFGLISILTAVLIHDEFLSWNLINTFLIGRLGTNFLGLVFFVSALSGLVLIRTLYFEFGSKETGITTVLMSFIGAVIMVYFKNYFGIIALVSAYLFFFVIIPISILKLGYFSADSLEREYKTTVELKDGNPLENLYLYQTTNTDYRFEDEEGNEYVIPVANVDKIIYREEKQE